MYVWTESCYGKIFLWQKHMEFTSSKTPNLLNWQVINTAENWATWTGFGIWLQEFNLKKLLLMQLFCMYHRCNQLYFFFYFATVHPKQHCFIKMHLLTKDFTLSLNKKRHHMPSNKMLSTLHAMYSTWLFVSL